MLREDVWVYYQRERGTKVNKLTVGYGEGDEEIGPELLFGHVLADHFGSPILLIKVTQGPMSLTVECRPPSSGGTVGPFYQRMIQTAREVPANLKKHFPEYQGQGLMLAKQFKRLG